MALITCKELTLGYDGVAIVENLSFSIGEGDYLSIVGENGSGKSTLMKTLLRLNSPLSGEIVFSEDLERHGIGYLPQQSLVQRDFPASVYEIVLSGCVKGAGYLPIYGKDKKCIALENMQKLGISELAKRPFSKLSGGQKQRVLLARALSATSKLLLLDEPASGLDPKATAQMYEIISELNRSHGITVAMISHDISASCRYSTHILHINKEDMFFGTKSDYLKSGIVGAFDGGAFENV